MPDTHEVLQETENELLGRENKIQELEDSPRPGVILGHGMDHTIEFVYSFNILIQVHFCLFKNVVPEIDIFEFLAVLSPTLYTKSYHFISHIFVFLTGFDTYCTLSLVFNIQLLFRIYFP